MTKYTVKYGNETKEFHFDEKNVIGTIMPNTIPETDLSPEDLMKEALQHPIDSPKLSELVKPGDTACVVVPDVTRLWQKPQVMTKVIIEELEANGIKDEDITIISAVGSHRMQTKEEHIQLVGQEIYDRIKVIDHDCLDYDNLVYVGTTKRGTEVLINKIAHDSDHLILTGGVVYHFLAGFGGGRKYILPGISSHKTIMKNHSHSLGEGLGSGSNPLVKSGTMDVTNPLADDMMDAAILANPEFIINVVANSDGKLTHAFTGNFISAHKAGCDVIDSRDGVYIDELAEMVIMSAGGYPNDINLYQTIKPLVNAKAAVKDGGIIIIASQASDGVGSPDLENMLYNMETTTEREKFLRENYTIGRNVAYVECEAADKYTLILVTDLPDEVVAKTNIKIARSIDDALEMAYKVAGRKDLKTYLMPLGGNTFPKLK